MVPISPKEGDIEDMENMNTQEKMSVLRSHKEWKCQKKRELLAEHANSWKTDGIASLMTICNNDINKLVIHNQLISDVCVKITVDIGLSGNNHWTDVEAALDFVNTV